MLRGVGEAEIRGSMQVREEVVDLTKQLGRRLVQALAKLMHRVSDVRWRSPIVALSPLHEMTRSSTLVGDESDGVDGIDLFVSASSGMFDAGDGRMISTFPSSTSNGDARLSALEPRDGREERRRRGLYY